MGEGEKNILDLRSTEEAGVDKGKAGEKPPAFFETQDGKKEFTAGVESNELSLSEKRQKGMDAITEVMLRNKEAFRAE